MLATEALSVSTGDKAAHLVWRPECAVPWGLMRTLTAVIERDPDTGLFVGYVPGWPGAHSQGASVDELRQNLEEVVAMLLEDAR